MVDGLAAWRGWRRCAAGITALRDASRARWLAVIFPAMLAAQPEHVAAPRSYPLPEAYDNFMFR